MGAGQPAFDHLSCVDQQMPAVGDVCRLAGAFGRAAGVFGRAVARDDPDPRPAPQPVRERRAGAVRQQIGDAPPLQVDQDGAIGAPLLERPLIDPQDTGRRAHRERPAPHEAQHRVGAHRHGQARREPRPGLAAQRDPDPPLSLGQPPRAAGTGREQTRQALGEGAPRAVRGATVEAAHAQADADLAPDGGQVGGTTAIAAVHGAADATATRAAAVVIATAMGDDTDDVRSDAMRVT